jgi:hypothetical protein
MMVRRQTVKAFPYALRAAAASLVIATFPPIQNSKKYHLDPFQLRLVIESVNFHSIGDSLRPISIGVMGSVNRLKKIINAFQHGRNIAANTMALPAKVEGC